MSHLIVDGVSVTFRRSSQVTPVLRDVSFQVEEREFVSLVGHSGCGKSTLLSVIAGLLRPDQGNVILGGVRVNAPGPDRAVVFQSHSLMPWLTVHGNVALAVDKLFGSSMAARERRAWVMHNLDLVGLSHAHDKYPSELSGGMKQRVGIARALAMKPSVLLLDEPFGALDALTRMSLQDHLLRIHESTRSTIVMITHDVDEAVLLSDRVLVMSKGPASAIKDALKVSLPQSRNRLELIKEQEYQQSKWQILSHLEA